MNKAETLEYITENFNLSGEAYRLISNILDFAEKETQYQKQQELLMTLLDNTIGLSNEEIQLIKL